ncbi:dienelactone hydrolase family protein [Paludisphaera rhizosphaerae]|uniref:dienelactone hydrolase family protein n=1 Tax=Paludisphaera rhizosphaerae TaxID=2711216 RepID=UPI0019818D84|nr:prolyl oligopeptidase family serine peptidase [Paludisphaera rhizosphaerae]
MRYDCGRRWMMSFGVLASITTTPLPVLAQEPAKAPAQAKEGTWQPNPQLLDPLLRRKTPINYRESEVVAYKLPDVLLCEDGTRVSSPEAWERKRRPETLELFRKLVYGRTPAKPSEVRFEVVERDPKAMDGQATRKRVRITSVDAGKSFRFEASLLVPNGKSGRTPAFLLINNRPESSADPSRAEKAGFWPAEEIIARGYATAVFRTNDVDPDSKDEAARARGVRGVWPAAGGASPGPDAWATIGAWAWGASRVLDYLETDPDVDASKVAVVGHSRGGKTALWAAAQDERFAIAVSNDSGCGGAALSRRNFGEDFKAINKGFPYWFCENFHAFDDREAELPVDQHQLLALIAPRGLYVASADADFWADQRGEFLSLANAAPAYAIYGLPGFQPNEMPPLESPATRGKVGYHIRTGVHDLTPYDWQRYMDFADQLWGKRAE